MELEAAKLAWECRGAEVDDDDDNEEEDEVEEEEMAARQADTAISLFSTEDVKLRLIGEGVLDKPRCRRRFDVVDRGGVIDKSSSVPASLRRFGVLGHRMATILV